MTDQTYKCANKTCGALFQARKADRKRGWARFCSKSCKAIDQTRRIGRWYMPRDLEEEARQAGLDAIESGWDGHKRAF
jgi:endogenous inhibitor of DNA gyrase (YacG/DUF329 family)